MRSFIDMEKLLVDHSNTVKEVQSMIRNQQSVLTAFRSFLSLFF